MSTRRAPDKPTAPAALLEPFEPRLVGVAPAPPAAAPQSTLSSAPSLSSLGLSPTPLAPVASASELPLRCPTCSARYPADFRVCPRDATPLEDAPEDADPLLGATLAESYEVLRVLGEGGMGRVYEARHTRLPNKRYAIKLLHHDLARQPEVVSRFQREAEAASALDHPNVVGVFDVNRTPDGRPYIVQELLDGEQLGDYLDRIGRMPIGAAVKVVRQVCRALAAAHARGIIHRDVKPENVVLTGDPATLSAKVLDFGISKVAESGAALTKTGMVMGTPAYMAPEQARGEKVDARADVYAAGAILYRAVTGRKPFDGLDPIATLTAVLSEEPPRPRSITNTVSEALELVIQRAMARDPAQRYASMDELDADLSAFDAADATVTLIQGSSAGGAVVDSAARTMMASTHETPTVMAAGAVAEAGRRARRARPALVGYTLLGLIGVVALLADGIFAILRWIAGDPVSALGRAELVLGASIAAALLIAPLILWIRFLVKGVWSSTPRAIETSDRLRKSLLAAASSYAVLTLAVRLVELAVLRAPTGIARPIWSLAALGLAAFAALASWFVPRLFR